MRRVPAALLCVLVLVALAATAVPAQAAQDRAVEDCAATPPEDFAPPDGNTSEVIGWVDGYWYDQPIDIDDPDRLTASERAAVLNRSAARVEALRCLPFEERPPVEFRNRSAFQASPSGVVDGTGPGVRQVENATFETLLMVGTERDALDAREATVGGTARGYYDPATEDLVLLVEDAGDPRVDEVTLAHEYVHALQDQHLELERFNATVVDRRAGETGLVEGDAVMVEHRYERRCTDGTWDCRDAPTTADDGDEANVGIELTLFQPYNDGPRFVEQVYEREGWEGVDDLYDEPPTTAYHLLYPWTYPAFEPRSVTVANHTNATEAGWERVRSSNRTDAQRLGPGAIGAAMMAPTFETGGQSGLYSPAEIQSGDDADDEPLSSLEYNHDVVDGWQGDRLEVYANESETTAVWRTTWTDEDAATTFRDRYVQLLAYRGATPADEDRNTFHFNETEAYSGIVYMGMDGDEVVVVHTPEHNEFVEHYEPEPDWSPGEVWDPNPYETDQRTASSDDGEDDGLPGFGIGATLVVLAGLVILAGRRARHR